MNDFAETWPSRAPGGGDARVAATTARFSTTASSPVFSPSSRTPRWCGSSMRTNLVECYVRRLRAKLGPDVIATLHGRGYAFVGATERECVRVATPIDEPAQPLAAS